MIVSTTDIQNNFGKYLKLSQSEELIITKNGKRVAKLIGYTEDEVQESWLVGEDSPAYRFSGVRVSYQEYLKIVEESENRYEYIDGEITLLSSPLYPHQKAIKEIFLQFGQWFRHKDCEPLTAPFDVTLFRLGNQEKVNVVQPDILVICDPEKIDEQGKYHGTPALVVEVLSDSTRMRDLVKKLDLYTESGIEEYWIVNTDSAEIYIYRFNSYSLHQIISFKNDEIAQSMVFPGLQVDLAQVFYPGNNGR